MERRVAQVSTEIQFLDGHTLVVNAAAENVLKELEKYPAAHGLVEITDGNGKVFLRRAQIAVVRSVTPKEGGDETPL
jgi:hypothetical protein